MYSRNDVFEKMKVIIAIGLMIWIIVLWGAIDVDFRTSFLRLTGNFVFGGNYESEPDVGCVQRPALIQDSSGSIDTGIVKVCIWN